MYLAENRTDSNAHHLAENSTDSNACHLKILYNGQVFGDHFEYLTFHLDLLTVMFVASGV